MAERNLTIVADHILEHLRSEDKKIGSLRRILLPELLQGFEGTVSTLAPLLLDAEKKSFGDERLKDWLLGLGDILFDADNLLEEIRLYSLYAAANSPKTTSKQLAGLLKQVRRFVLISTSSNYVVPRFKKINKSLERIAAERNEFNLEELSEDIQLPVAEVARETSTTPSSEVGREIFARSKDKEEIVRILLDADAGLIERAYAKVLPIYGQAGLGRTSLAKDAFHDERVRRCFDRQMWVRVSKNMDVKEILKEMVAFATSGSIENLHDVPESQLAAQLQDSLQGKRCLSVLEDESDEPSNKWPQLEYRVLQVGARGSAIILITSSRWFAEIAGNVKPFCSEGGLNYKQYHRTYFDKANSKGSMLFHKELTTIGDEILRQCHGHPLLFDEILRQCHGHPFLFSAIGSMLSLDYKEQVWWSFYENELLRTLECYVRDARFRDCQLLKLSYDHLPFRLKHCFAYCSLFLRGHEIDVQMLIKLWMAQGFIDPKDSTQSLEEVGYKYFMNLLSRSFFYEVAVDVSGRVTKCKMHDLMHDLATYVGGKQCRLLNSRSAKIDTRASHLSFGADLSFNEHVSSLKSAKKLRSILLPTKLRRKDREAPDDGIFYIISNCRFLRVLDLHALGIKKVPISIGKLYHLRYLDLSENEYITKLPDSITELLNLQTLRLSSCFELKKLPREIGKLINLRHLELDGCYSLVSLPRGIGKLTNLQTLSQLVLSEDASTRNNELEQLKGLNNLTEDFEIKNLKHGGDDIAATYFDVIRQKVRSLSLEWESHASESDDNDTQLNTSLFSDLEKLSLNGFRGDTLFSFGFPCNLVKLSLRRCAKCIVLPAISQCHKLKVLALDEMTDLEYVENEGVSSQGEFFPDLQELWLRELPKLQGWWKPSSVSFEKQEYLPSFPRLSKLAVEDCPKLDSMPLFPTLEDGLVLDSTCWNPLTMKHRAAATKNEVSSSTSSQSTPLSKLKKLCIVDIPAFDDSKANEIEWHNLESLQLLKFDSLPGLTTLPEGLKPATNQAEGGKLAGTNQPEGRKPVTKLQELHVWRCGLRELPAWIGKLELLEKLVIRACPMMGTLPGEIRGLKYLKTVEIDDCPMLQRRCEEGIGADWDKISHIETRQVRRISGS